MADHCLVIPGEWTSVDSIWNFVIDKKTRKRSVGLMELRLWCGFMYLKQPPKPTSAPPAIPSTILFAYPAKMIHIGRKTYISLVYTKRKVHMYKPDRRTHVHQEKIPPHPIHVYTHAYTKNRTNPVNPDTNARFYSPTFSCYPTHTGD